MSALKIDLTQLDLGLSANTNYTITIEQGLVKEVGNNRAPNPVQDSVKSFTSFSTPPQVTSTNTTKSGEFVTSVGLDWDRVVQLKNGNIYIYNGEGVYRTIAASSSSVAIFNDAQLKVVVNNEAMPEDDYYLAWSSAIVRDLQGIVADASSSPSVLPWSVTCLSTITNGTYDSTISNPEFSSNWFTILDRSSEANEQYTLTLTATSGTFTATVGTTVGNTWTYTATRQEIDAVNSLHFDANVANMNWDLPFTTQLERDGIVLATRNNTLVGIPYTAPSITVSANSFTGIISETVNVVSTINTTTNIDGVEGGAISYKTLKLNNVGTSTQVPLDFPLPYPDLQPSIFYNPYVPNNLYVGAYFTNTDLVSRIASGSISSGTTATVSIGGTPYISPGFYNGANYVSTGSVYFKLFFPQNVTGYMGYNPFIAGYFRDHTNTEQYLWNWDTNTSNTGPAGGRADFMYYWYRNIWSTATVAVNVWGINTSTTVDFFVDTTVTNTVSTGTFVNNTYTETISNSSIGTGTYKVYSTWEGCTSVPKFYGTSSDYVTVTVLPKDNMQIRLQTTASSTLSTATVSLSGLQYEPGRLPGTITLSDGTNTLGSTSSQRLTAAISNLTVTTGTYDTFRFTSSDNLIEAFTATDRLQVLVNGNEWPVNSPNCYLYIHPSDESRDRFNHRTALNFRLTQDATTSTIYYLEARVTTDTYDDQVGQWGSGIYPVIMRRLRDNANYFSTSTLSLYCPNKEYGAVIRWNPSSYGESGTVQLTATHVENAYYLTTSTTGTISI